MEFVTDDGQNIPIVSTACDTVIWLGAGFSRAATDGVAPLMNDFFSTLDASTHPHLTRYLTAKFGDVHSANVETALQAIEQLQTSPLPARLRNSILAGQDPKRIRRELEAYCLERLDYRLGIDNWAIQLLAHANERTTVITTNYDMLADQVLSRRVAATHCSPNATCHHCNMMAILREGCSCRVTPSKASRASNAALFKLHGSLAWHTCTNVGCNICDCLVPHCNYKTVANSICECCGESSHPVLLLPSMVKRYDQFPQLERIWIGADDALSRATTFTVVGFSFPQSDSLVCDVFRSAVARGRKLRNVVIIDVNPSAVAGRIRALLPRDLAVGLQELVVPPDGSVPHWFKDEHLPADCV